MISTVNIQGIDYPIGASYDNEGNVIADTYALQDNVNQQINNLKTQIKQAVTNLPDEEDLTFVKESERNVLKLADKRYAPENFSGKGYKILRKNIVDGKNVLTQEMINKSNVIYEIRYDFDLNGKSITIPEGCTLKFEGGKFSNGTLHGNNTKIIADPSDHIFSYDRTKNYIDGTWKINKWYCAWFGTVADGKAYRAKYDDSGQLVKDNANTSFEVIIEGTDNYLPIQEALDTAFSTNVKNVELGLGVYRICTPLNIGWGNKAYHSIYFSGVKRGTFGDIREADKHSTKILVDTGTYGICVNSGYCSHLTDFDILGWNGINYRKMFTMWQNTIYYVKNPEDWNSERVNKLPSHGLEPMSPYAGIVTDAFIGYEGATNPYELPTPPCNYPTFVAANSTGFTMTNVKSMGFCVGFGIEVGNYADNADFYKFYNCSFEGNVYGLSTGSNQARNTALHECDLGNCYTAITNTKVGKRNGGLYGFISNCWFDSCYKIIEYKEDISPIVFYNCYCENSYMIGNSFNRSSRLENNIKFVDCSFRFTHRLSNPLGIPACLFNGNCELIRTTISLGDDAVLIPLFMEVGQISNCDLVINTLQRQRECLFLPYMNSRLNVSEVSYSNKINRINEYCSNVGGMKIKLDRITSSKQLRHRTYSYNEATRILTLETDWIESAPSYQNEIQSGDIIYQYGSNTIYAIIKITPKEDNKSATLLCTPICGFRKENSRYICYQDVSNSLWTVFPTRIQAFDKPLVITNANGKELTLKKWDEALKAGISLSRFHDYEHSFNFESGLIEAVDKENRKITLKYDYWLDDTFKVINGYLDLDSKYWKDTWVQDFIDQYN